MNIPQSTLLIAAALTYKGIGPGWIIKNQAKLNNQEFDEFVALLLRDAVHEAEPLNMRHFRVTLTRIEEQLNHTLTKIDGIVSFLDPMFPDLRGSIKDGDRPVLLYYRGDISLLKKKNRNIAVVGHLHPDAATIRFEEAVVDELVNDGITIVSGLAQGCDAVAHQQTLARGGKTVAVLPSPVDAVIPSQHRDLADQIAQNDGLLVSEYGKNPLSRMEQISRFVTRDRLQAAFSDGVVLVASYAEADKGFDSGSRHALSKAKQYSIPRAVLYDAPLNTNDPAYNLNRQLRSTDSVTTITPSTIRASLDNFLSAQTRTTDAIEVEQTSMF
jgi:DNA processing protein